MKVYIIGAGGHGEVVWDTLEEMGYSPSGFLDDAYPEITSVSGKPVLGKVSLAKELEGLFVVAIGDNLIRRKIVSKLNFPDERFLTVIHPTAFVAKDVKIGAGTMIIAHSVINTGSVIGKHVIVNTSASLDHHNFIEDFAHIAPGTHTGGNVKIKECAFVGIGVSVIPGKTIGKWATVGAGSVVIEDVPDYATVVGVPARVIKIRKEEIK